MCHGAIFGHSLNLAKLARSTCIFIKVVYALPALAENLKYTEKHYYKQIDRHTLFPFKKLHLLQEKVRLNNLTTLNYLKILI